MMIEIQQEKSRTQSAVRDYQHILSWTERPERTPDVVNTINLTLALAKRRLTFPDSYSEENRSSGTKTPITPSSSASHTLPSSYTTNSSTRLSSSPNTSPLNPSTPEPPKTMRHRSIPQQTSVPRNFGRTPPTVAIAVNLGPRGEWVFINTSGSQGSSSTTNTDRSAGNASENRADTGYEDPK